MTRISLQAGTARQIITPPRGIFLIGYGDRSSGNIGVHDDLTATALVFSDTDRMVAIVSLDILAINEFIVDRIRALVEPVEVVLCCSHTHSGPIAYANSRSSRLNQEYIDSLISNIVTAIHEAQGNLVPVRLYYSVDQGDVGINRRERMADGHFQIGRNPGGPRDNTVQVISVNRIGEPESRLATIVNYACHGTVLGPDNLLVSADWIGEMRRELETELGGMVLFLQGAAADINPDMYWKDNRAFEMVSKQGQLVASAVRSAIENDSRPFSGLPISIERQVVWLPTEAHAVTKHPPRNYGRPLLALANMPGFMALFVDILLNARYPWRSTIVAKDGYWSVPMRINGVRLGDLVLVTFAAETFTEIGIKIKRASPAPFTLFASVSDGCISYLHTTASHQEGGYEVDVAPLAYRYPGRLQASCESLALERTSLLLDKLWNSSIKENKDQ